MNRLVVPNYAKKKALAALRLRSRLPKSKKFGLDRKEAKRLGIVSGVDRARQLIRARSISFQDAKRVSAFARFLPAKSPKERGAVNLWGGERFIRRANSFVSLKSK